MNQQRKVELFMYSDKDLSILNNIIPLRQDFIYVILYIFGIFKPERPENSINTCVLEDFSSII
jgi:hypothetical protein